MTEQIGSVVDRHKQLKDARRRLGMSRPNAARYLNMSLRVFDEFVIDNEIPCVYVKERQRFEKPDLDAAIERQKIQSTEKRMHQECASGGQRNRRTGTTTCKFEVIGFEEARIQRQKERQR